MLEQGTASTSLQVQQLNEQATMWQGQAASLPHLPLRQVSRWLAEVWQLSGRQGQVSRVLAKVWQLSGSRWLCAKIWQDRQPSTRMPLLPSFKAWQPDQSMTRA